MTGRLVQLQIPPWEEHELEQIAAKGFAALNVRDEDDLARRLAKESFGSPHLMQDFCLELCKENGIRESQRDENKLNAPSEWTSFFAARASEAEKAAFDRLARGPRQRKDRKVRPFRTGGHGDIYEAVLKAIASTGPQTSLTYEEIRSALRDVLSDEVPQSYEVTRVLDEMTKIARQDIEGEPVVDWDVDLRTLYISDPFFAFFLRWGI